jgi:hypothetical protein
MEFFMAVFSSVAGTITTAVQQTPRPTQFPAPTAALSPQLRPTTGLKASYKAHQEHTLPFLSPRNPS